MDDQAEDEAQFTALYREHYRSVTAYVQRRCDSSAWASQVVSETFTVAWRRLPEATRGGRPWLFRTAGLTLKNVERTERRQRRTAARSAVLDPPREQQDDGASLTDALLVRSVLASLSRRDQEVLRLVYWDDLSGQDLATVLGCSARTASVRLHRARGRFERAMSAAEFSLPTDRSTPLTREETHR